MRVRFVLFDLDGTLLDTLADLTKACNYALETLGYRELTEAEVRIKVGDGVPALMHRALPPEKRHEAEQAVALFRGWYATHTADRTRPYPGIPELIWTLTEKGIKLGVVTNKPQYAVDILCDCFFSEIGVRLGDAPGRRTKPAPDMGNAAMLALSARPENTVYIGDSDTDTETAKNLGVPFIGASWGYRGGEFLLKHGAETVADTPEDVPELIDRLNRLGA